MHHTYVDTDKDVHSPKNDGTILKMMIKTKDYYMNIYTGKFKVEDRFLDNLPEWKSFDTFAHGIASRTAWGVLYILFYIYFAPSLWFLFLIPIHLLMGPIHGVIINWFSHKVGYRNHDSNDTSTNLFPVEVLMLGEGLHNNHHHSASRANFAQKWFEIDPTYISIWVMDKLNIIQLKK
jgi:stearoyl-CoA desaturase (delta-9 desaturase)